MTLPFHDHDHDHDHEHPLLTRQTYDDADRAALARLRHVLQTGSPHLLCLESAAGLERVALPDSIQRLLHQVVDAMETGLAVTVAPHTRMLSSAQAADLLTPDRPAAVRRAEPGMLPF